MKAMAIFFNLSIPFFIQTDYLSDEFISMFNNLDKIETSDDISKLKEIKSYGSN